MSRYHLMVSHLLNGFVSQFHLFTYKRRSVPMFSLSLTFDAMLIYGDPLFMIPYLFYMPILKV